MWTPDDVGGQVLTKVVTQGLATATVEKQSKKWLYWIHSKGKCVSYGTETTENKAKKTAEQVISKL